MTAPTRPSQIAASNFSKPGRLTRRPIGRDRRDNLDVLPTKQSRPVGRPYVDAGLQIVRDLLAVDAEHRQLRCEPDGQAISSSSLASSGSWSPSRARGSSPRPTAPAKIQRLSLLDLRELAHRRRGFEKIPCVRVQCVAICASFAGTTFPSMRLGSNQKARSARS